MEKLTAPTEEEFLAWRDDPVTAYVRGAFLKMAEAQRHQWLKHTWDTGNCDSYSLCELRVRADTFKAIAEADLSDIVAAHEEAEEE
jgi:hypothetical protein